MRNSSILIFISIFNIAHSMGCLEFNEKLNELEDNFSQIFIMNYKNVKVIYARKDNKFYVSFVELGLFVKFDECIEKNGSSHIIISNISSNKKYEFNLNAKLETPSESFVTISDSSKTSFLYEDFIAKDVSIGVNRKDVLEYLSHIGYKYAFYYYNYGDAEIKDYILNQNNPSNDEFILYNYGDLSADKGTEFNEQSIAEPLDVKVDEGETVGVAGDNPNSDLGTLRVHREGKKGKKRARTESEEGEAVGVAGDNPNSDLGTLRVHREGKKGKKRARTESDEGEAVGVAGASSGVNEPMEVDFEHGVINSSKENDQTPKIRNISLTNLGEISRILDNLTKDELIKLKLEQDKTYDQKEYKEITIKRNNNTSDKKYYDIILSLVNGGQKTRLNQKLHFKKNKDKIQLDSIYSTQSARNNPLYESTEESQNPPRIRLRINGFDLYLLSTTNTEEESKEIKEYYAEVIRELNKKYDQNFVSFKKNVLLTDSSLVLTKIKELTENQTIVVIFHGHYRKKKEYKEIKIVKKKGSHYDISIIRNDLTGTSLENHGISLMNDNCVGLKIYISENKSQYVSILHTDLYISS